MGVIYDQVLYLAVQFWGQKIKVTTYCTKMSAHFFTEVDQFTLNQNFKTGIIFTGLSIPYMIGM